MPSSSSRRAGFSLVEVVLVMAITSVALAMFARIMASSARLDPLAAESALAAEAARTTLELIRGQDVADVVALYNDDPTDDPGGLGTAPGPEFAVAGLAPVKADGMCGLIELPALEGAIREDVEDALLGLPRDLNGDGVVDDEEHSADWLILPVRVRVTWMSTSSRSQRTYALHTMLPRL